MLSGRQSRPPVAVLCGAARTGLGGGAPSVPQPLVEVGRKPILWHVIQIYLSQGFDNFALLTGFRGEMIERFVASEVWPESADVRCVDTGADTPTGGRLRRAAHLMAPGTVCVTYADGVADID